MHDIASLLGCYDSATGRIAGRPLVERRLSDLRGSFADTAAYETALRAGNPLLYSVSSVEPGRGPGDLHYGLGLLQPGRIGDEYFLTKGHLHSWRPAAEVYVGLRGTGAMLLEDEHSGEAQLIELGAGQIVYVPGNTAHRTVNTGTEPLVYLGIYPAAAGHDYQSIAAKNFAHVVVTRAGRPTLVRRSEYRPAANP
ncbi:MAG: cupin domain-containing protein [Candidatus Didemnitutus sp.]|nr:cupin domain-containing protein [Candidatus Didemnitutus sp.]